ncbi:response regulator transcription factor [Fusibacter ferrireducens]|uniref:Stage 0 sporulation protein A homolog n=1 Tax=Fusibacter ferrireducens TaxID=2785058 RepID=A0ABR9ZSW0_9FIRM|nr:response regulator transcription factor [Fusibacter ferrireducens]MBF4693530.1 response regulator transcription factor [Fusibacter ferrireducens]
MHPYKILLIEDNPDICEMLSQYLIREGYTVDLAMDGELGLHKALHMHYDLLLLDLTLPKLSGMEVLKQLRMKTQIPVLIISAKDKDVDKALGLGFGADDYIAKPFSLIEVSARVSAAIRRATHYSTLNTVSELQSNTSENAKLTQIGALKMDFENYAVYKNDQFIKLTNKEFGILRLLATNPKRVYSKAQLYEQIWEENYYGDENVINVQMRRLREKIEDNPSDPKYIVTIWGIGYKFGDFS